VSWLFLFETPLAYEGDIPMQKITILNQSTVSIPFLVAINQDDVKDTLQWIPTLTGELYIASQRDCIP
jgi:hypothetical protein